MDRSFSNGDKTKGMASSAKKMITKAMELRKEGTREETGGGGREKRRKKREGEMEKDNEEEWKTTTNNNLGSVRKIPGYLLAGFPFLPLY